MKERDFVAIYFPYNTEEGKKTRNVAVSFNDSTEKDLYYRVKELSSTDLKRLISIHSYEHLEKLCEKEDRKKTELIKLRLKEKLLRRKGDLQTKSTLYKQKDVEKWLKYLEGAVADKENRNYRAIVRFFSDFIDRSEKVV